MTKLSTAWATVISGVIVASASIVGGAFLQKELKLVGAPVVKGDDFAKEGGSEKLLALQTKIGELERLVQQQREQARQAADDLEKFRREGSQLETAVATERTRAEQEARRANEAEKVAAAATAEAKRLSDQLARAVVSVRSERPEVASVTSMPTVSTRVLRVDILGIQVTGNDIEVVFRFLNLGDQNLPWMPLSPPTYLSDQNGNQFVLDLSGGRGQQMNLTPQVPLSRTYLFRGRTPPVGKLNAVLTNNYSIRDAHVLTMYGIGVGR